MDCGRFSNFTSRRELLARAGYGIGAAALTCPARRPYGAPPPKRFPNFAPRAKRVIFLFQAGGPSHLDLLDYKPEMKGRFDQDIPPSIFGGQRVTGMVAQQDRFPVVPTMYGFKQYGQCGRWLSDLLPHTGKIADEICVLRAMHTEAINHDPAITFIQTGSQLPGRPCIGSWVDYGLGSENAESSRLRRAEFPAWQRHARPGPAVAAVGRGLPAQPLSGRAVPQRGRPGPLPVQSPGHDARAAAASILDGLAALNQQPPRARRRPRDRNPHRAVRDGVSHASERARTDGYLQRARARATPSTAPTPASPAPSPPTACWRAGWPSATCGSSSSITAAGTTTATSPTSSRPWPATPTSPRAGLILDLKQRGMLDDTLVIWGGEFGRTPYAQGAPKPDNYGRDHHGRVFSLWMAGGGVKRGYAHGSSDDFGFNVVEGGVHIHDLQATILHLLGIDHEKLTYLFQGRHFRLTDVEGRVVREIIA